MFSARCYEYDFDYGGNDIGGFTAGVASAQACQAICQGVPTCTHFTYGYSGSDAGKCWSKTSDAGRKANVGYVSGAKYC